MIRRCLGSLYNASAQNITTRWLTTWGSSRSWWAWIYLGWSWRRRRAVGREWVLVYGHSTSQGNSFVICSSVLDRYFCFRAYIRVLFHSVCNMEQRHRSESFIEILKMCYFSRCIFIIIFVHFYFIILLFIFFEVWLVINIVQIFSYTSIPLMGPLSSGQMKELPAYAPSTCSQAPNSSHTGPGYRREGERRC